MSLDIMNQALALLEEEQIQSLSDNRAAARWMRLNYEPIRDSLLRLHPWNCARRRVKLSARSEAPAFGFRYAYPKPADCVRVLPLASLGARNGRPIDFAVEGADILTNAGAPLCVIYIRKIESGDMDALLKRYLATTLATAAANYITGKQSYAERMGQMAADLKLSAQMANSLEGVPEQPYDDDWVTGRQIGVADQCWDGGWGVGDMSLGVTSDSTKITVDQ